jgi:hypothetical protein
MSKIKKNQFYKIGVENFISWAQRVTISQNIWAVKELKVPRVNSIIVGLPRSNVNINIHVHGL